MKIKIGDVVKTSSPVPGNQSVGRVICVDGDTVLIEFPKKDMALHDGWGRGKENHCWWQMASDLTVLPEMATIYSAGGDTYCTRTGKRAIGMAKLHGGDKPNDLTGAIIALAKAYGASPTEAAKRVLTAMGSTEVPTTVSEDKAEAAQPAPAAKPKKRLLFRGQSYGIIGTPTKMVDRRGEHLCVGDMVLLFRPSGEQTEYPRLVVEDSDYQFVMGIKGSVHRATGEITGGWSCEKLRSWKLLDEGYVDPDPDFTFTLEDVEDVEEEPSPAEEPKKKLVLCDEYGKVYGDVGDPTPLVDKNGEKLFIGDIVRCYRPEGGAVAPDEPICYNTTYGPVEADFCYPMGLGFHDFCKSPSSDGWTIERMRSFRDLKVGEALSDNYLTVTEEVAKEPKKKLALRWSFGSHASLGNVGDPTPLVDCNGEKLFIGDIVECSHDGVVVDGHEPIVVFKEAGPKSNGGYYAMGLGSIDFAVPDGHRGYDIKKVKSYEELRAGERLSGGVVEVVCND